MREEDKVLDTVKTFIRLVLQSRDTEKVLEFISEDIMGVGIYEQGIISSKEDVRRVLQAKNETEKFDVSFPKADACFHPPCFATARVVYELCYMLDGKEMRDSFIQTASLKKAGEEWKICYLQAVPVSLTEESIVHYPLKIADKALSNLREELQEESFQFLCRSLSVGILGAYLTGGDLPPFYINDSMLSMLGYTYQEYVDLMNDNSFSVVHPDDKEWVEKTLLESAQKDGEYTCQYRLITKSGKARWVVEHGKVSQRDGKDIVLAAFVDVTTLVELQQALEQKNQTISSSITYASRIQKNLLPAEALFQKAFRDYSIIWQPKDAVGGDIYWFRQFETGFVLCLADCTGHGVPGALLTALVSAALDMVVTEENCRDTAKIMAELDRRAAEILHCESGRRKGIADIRDGCDIAVVFIAKDGSVRYSSAGIPVFSCDGREVKRRRGQRFFIGEGALSGPEQVESAEIAAGADIFIATDGLFDQIGQESGKPFGYRTFESLLLQQFGKKHAEISGKIWEAFEAHRGGSLRRDDVAFLSFRT